MDVHYRCWINTFCVGEYVRKETVFQQRKKVKARNWNYLYLSIQIERMNKKLLHLRGCLKHTLLLPTHEPTQKCKSLTRKMNNSVLFFLFCWTSRVRIYQLKFRRSPTQSLSVCHRDTSTNKLLGHSRTFLMAHSLYCKHFAWLKLSTRISFCCSQYWLQAIIIVILHEELDNVIVMTSMHSIWRLILFEHHSHVPIQG